jgi:hypothetical protein
MDNNRTLQALRAQAWERAKGELNSINQASFPPSPCNKEDYQQWEKKCARRRSITERFIKEMEDDELYL